MALGSQYQPPAYPLGALLFNLGQSSWCYAKDHKGLANQWRLTQTVLRLVGSVLRKYLSVPKILKSHMQLLVTWLNLSGANELRFLPKNFDLGKAFESDKPRFISAPVCYLCALVLFVLTFLCLSYPIYKWG